jgi:hypothetical protein
MLRAGRIEEATDAVAAAIEHASANLPPGAALAFLERLAGALDPRHPSLRCLALGPMEDLRARAGETSPVRDVRPPAASGAARTPARGA